MHGVAEDSYC